MSNETMAEVAAPAATASKGIDAELQALGRLAAEVDGFSQPKVEDQAPRNPVGVPTAGENEKAEKANQRTASTTDSRPEDPTSREIKSLDVGPDREKSRNRLGQLWEQFNQKQREFADERARFQAEAEQARLSPPKNPKEAYSADELREFAKEWENEGRDDLAKEARQRAAQIEETDRKAKILEEENRTRFESRVRQNWDSLTKENPDLQDKSSDLYQTTMSYMQHNDPLVRDFLNRHPDGLVLANALAKLQLAGESAADAVKEVERLKAENQKLKSKMSLGTSNPSAPVGEKSIRDMSTAEAESYVRSLAAQADGF